MAALTETMHFGRGTVYWRLDRTVKASGRRTHVEVGMKDLTRQAWGAGHSGWGDQGVERHEDRLCKELEGSVIGMSECQDQVWGAPPCPSFLGAPKQLSSSSLSSPFHILKPIALTTRLWSPGILSLPIFPQFLALRVEETKGEKLCLYDLTFLSILNFFAHQQSNRKGGI